MSEIVPTDELTEPPSAPTNTPTIEATGLRATNAPGLGALHPSAEMQAALELIGRGLTDDADGAARARASEVWSQLMQLITAAGPPTPSSPTAPPAPPPPVAPAASLLPTLPSLPTPTSPIAAAARALRQLPREQLLELVLQRLRSALPAGTPMPTPRGIQFQLLPVSPPTTVLR